MTTPLDIKYVVNPIDFSDWCGLLDLMKQAFSHTIGKIDPPSSIYSSTPEQLVVRAKTETLLLALQGTRIVGCLFMKVVGDELFLGRFVVALDLRGCGLARQMINLASCEARQHGLHRISLEVRVALTENQVKFQALGFEITGGRAHDGFEKITTLKMEKYLPTTA